MHWKCPRCAWVNETRKAFETKTCFKCGYHDGHQPHAFTDDVAGDIAREEEEDAADD